MSVPHQIEAMVNQLGGIRSLNAMIGVKHIAHCIDKNGNHQAVIQFKAKASNKANIARVTLEASDTYKVDFMRVHGINITTISEHELIYCDRLKSLFEDETGLCLSVPFFA